MSLDMYIVVDGDGRDQRQNEWACIVATWTEDGRAVRTVIFRWPALITLFMFLVNLVLLVEASLW